MANLDEARKEKIVKLLREVIDLIGDSPTTLSKPIENSPITLRKAAKKYGIPLGTLSEWGKRGRIKVIQYPMIRGQSMLVDELSVYEAWEQLKARYRPK